MPPRRARRSSSRRSLAGAAIVVLAAAACARDAPRPGGAVAPSALPSTSAAPEDRSIRYLALGDSFTAGTGSSREEAFPSRLADRWRSAGLSVTLSNLAVNGYTAGDLIEHELPQLAGFRPTIVTLAIGANDFVRGSSADRYRRDVRTILTTILAAGVDAKHVVALPQPDWSKSPAASSFGDARSILSAIEQFNAVLREETVMVGGLFVDLFPLMEQEAAQNMISGDGLHPSAPAEDAWAAELYRRLPH